MTVNKAGTSSSSTTKKKKTSSSSTTASTSTSKTSKVVESKASKHEIVHSEGLSKSSSSSSLQISDVSHLPLQAHLTSYLVTETLPTGSGEKITTYHPETGASSTEYRHFVAQDTSSQHSADIQQIGSILNQSIQNLNESTSNLSQISGSTYTVTEPMEELRLSYNANDSAWNGKFIQEQSVQKGKKSNTIVKQSSTATSHEESSSSAKTTSSSYAVEIVDGKERIVDQKHHEASSATHSSNDERLDMRSGTGVQPEVHYTQKSTKSSTKMDSAKPELQQPKTKSSQAVREIHQVGDNITSSTNVIQDKAVSSTHALRDKTTNFIDNEIADSINKQSTSTTSIENTSKNLDSASSATKTVTYYDSKGNVVKTVTEVDSHIIPGSEVTSSDITKTFSDRKTSNIHSSQTISDSKNVHGHVADSSSTVYDSTGRVVKDNTYQSTDIHSNDRLHGKTQSPVTSTPRKQKSPDRKHPPTKTDETTTYYVDENFVDTNKIKQAQISSDSSNFYGHRVDSSKTVVGNVYDTSAIQNTIGYRENVVMDQTMDTTDLVFSNDRNYGKTGWNGQFTYETPQSSKKSGSPDKKSPPSVKPVKKSPNDISDAGTKRSPSPSKTPTKTPSGEQPAAGVPSRKSPEKQQGKSTVQTQDFLEMETQENIKQFTEKDTNEWKKTIDEGSSTVIEGDTTIEYFKIVDGKKIPIGQKVIPGQTTTESYDNITGRRESKSTIHDSKVLEDITEQHKTVDTTKKSKRVAPEDLPAAGMPTRKPTDKKPTNQKSGIKEQKDVRRDSTTTEYTEVEGDTTIEYFTIVDGKKIPAGTKVIPGRTKTEIYDSTTSRRDSSTTVEQNLQTFVDQRETTERYEIIEDNLPKGRRTSPEKIPAAGIPSRKPTPGDSTTTYTETQGDTTIEYFEIVDGKKIPAGRKVFPGSTNTETYNTEESVLTESVIDRSREDRNRPDKKQPKRAHPEDFPAAGMPSRKPTDKTVKPKDTEDYDGYHKTLDEGSSTIIEGDTTIEYFKIVDGKKIPIGQKVIPGSTTTEYYDNITGRRESKTTVHDTKMLIDSTNIIDEYTNVEQRKSPEKTPSGKAPRKISPEDLPAAGMPTRKYQDDRKVGRTDQEDLRRDSTTTEYTEIQGDTIIQYFDIVDGRRVPKGTKVIPGGTTTTTGKIHETSERRDSVTNITKNVSDSSKTFVESTNIFEEHKIVDGKKVPKVGRTDQKDIRRDSTTEYTEIQGDTVIEYFDIIDGRRVPKGTKLIPGGTTTTTGKVHESTERRDSVTNITKNVNDTSRTIVESTNIFEEHQIIDGKKVPMTRDSRKPEKVYPEELPAAGMPSKRDPKYPKRPDSPQNNKPTKGFPGKQPDQYSTDTVENIERVSKVFDSKTTVIRDSQTSVDNQSILEHYTIVNGERVPVGPEPKAPVGGPKRPEELPAAGVPSRKSDRHPDDRSPKKAESPARKDKVRPEDLPAAGRRSKPDDKNKAPKTQPDDLESLTVQSFETVSKVFDSKTTVIKDSQTFVDRESTAEHYTIVDGERVSVKPADKRPIEDLKRPEDLPVAGMPSRKPERKTDDASPKKKSESPTRKHKVQPEDLPAAGRPTKPDDKTVAPKTKLVDLASSTTVESFETVSKVFDSKTTVIKDSQTFVDRESTAEHYTIVNGERVPVKPSDKRPIEDSKRPEDLPVAGMPSRKPERKTDDASPKKKPESPTRKHKVQPEDLPVAGRPSKPDDRNGALRKQPTEEHPDDLVSSTTVESFETVSKVFDSKTTVIKDSQTFVDRESTAEQYTIVNGERVPTKRPIEDLRRPDELPAAGMPSKRPEKHPDDKSPKKKSESPVRRHKVSPEDLPAAGRPTKPGDIVLARKPTDSDRTSESFETVSKVYDTKTTVTKDSQTFIDRESTAEHYTIINGERVPSGPRDRKPIEDSKYPEEMPAAGMPSRKPQKHPDDSLPKKKTESPTKKKVAPEDFPAAGKPSKPDDKLVTPKRKPSEQYPEIHDNDSTTTVESFETVSKVFDSKTSIIKDSKTFVDNQSTVEHYTIVNGERIPLGPRDRQPIEDFSKPEDLPAAGMPSRKDKKGPNDKTPVKKTKSPTRKDKVHPEDLPAAGRPSKPTDKSVVPVHSTDSSTVETFETVSKVFDSKTTVIKDSQTFVDQHSNVEHYTIINGERVPTDKKPIREKPSRKSPDELPAAGRPSRKSPETKPTTTTTVVENYTTDVRDIKDTIVRDTVDRVDRTFIKEDIIDIKDINEVENITNIQRVSENKVIKVEKVIKEPAPTKHYKPPMKEQCICELCTCGESSTCSHK